MAINKKAIKASEEAILKILGNLSDLPYDMANTVCNVYYTYFRETFPHQKHNLDNLLGLLHGLNNLLGDDSDNPFAIARVGIDAMEDTKKTGSHDSIIGAELLCISQLIQALRITRDSPVFKNDKTYYFQLLDLIPDIFKYRIKRAFDKTPIRRNVERKIRQNRVNEMPHLIEFMDVYIDDDENEY